MISGYILIGIAVAALIAVTIFRLELWPLFSSYPMFSRVFQPQEIRVYRLRLCDSNGDKSWWNPPFSHQIQAMDFEVRHAMRETEREARIGGAVKEQFDLKQPGPEWSEVEIVLRSVISLKSDGRPEFAEIAIWRAPIAMILEEDSDA